MRGPGTSITSLYQAQSPAPLSCPHLPGVTPCQLLGAACVYPTGVSLRREDVTCITLKCVFLFSISTPIIDLGAQPERRAVVFLEANDQPASAEGPHVLPHAHRRRGASIHRAAKNWSSWKLPRRKLRRLLVSE